MNLVVRADALKRRSEECAAELKKLEEALKVLEQKRKKQLNKWDTITVHSLKINLQ